MRYAILMYADPAYTVAMPREELEQVGRKHEALRAQLTGSGELRGGEGLVLPADTTVVRLRDNSTGSRVESRVESRAGPLTAEREQLTAWYVVECADAERARQIAEHILDTHVTAVEVRAIHDSVTL